MTNTNQFFDDPPKAPNHDETADFADVIAPPLKQINHYKQNNGKEEKFPKICQNFSKVGHKPKHV
jgi:hypothetical protein